MHTETPAPALGEESDRARELERNRYLPRPAERLRMRIVCIGGGTGLPTILRGLARMAEAAGLDITAVVAMSDDGGSSGRLRRTRGILPPGDIRNCLVALAGGDPTLRDVFNYRFGGAKGLAGHAVGNLLIAALAELKGDFLEAVRASARLLAARGRVLPSTLAPVQLVAQLEDDTTVVGERKIALAQSRVKRVALSPKLPPPSDGTLEAIAEADLIVLGPGSLYSSLLPNLLVDGVAQGLRETRALKVLIANLMTQPGETDGMAGAAHLRAVVEHVGPVVDVVLYNGTPLPAEALARYRLKGSAPVQNDRRALLELGVLPIEADLLRASRRLRHDSRKVARVLLKLARDGV